MGNPKVVLLGMGAIVAVVILLLVMPMTFVSAGERGVGYNKLSGNYKLYGQGFHFKAPSIIEPVKDYNVRNVPVTWRNQDAGSKDLQSVMTDVTVTYRINPDNVQMMYELIGDEDDMLGILEPRIVETTKKVTARFTAEQLLVDRETVKTMFKEELEAAFADYESFVVLKDASLSNFDFSEEFDAEIEKKVRATQERDREAINLEKEQILAEQVRVKAQASADAKLKVGLAEAEVLNAQKEVTTPDLVRLRMIEKWNGALSHTMLSDASQVLLGV